MTDSSDARMVRRMLMPTDANNQGIEWLRVRGHLLTTTILADSNTEQRMADQEGLGPELRPIVNQAL